MTTRNAMRSDILRALSSEFVYRLFAWLASAGARHNAQQVVAVVVTSGQPDGA